MNSDVSNILSLIGSQSSIIISVMAVLISSVSAYLQFRKRRAFVFPLNSEEVQSTIAVPYMNVPEQVREQYPAYDDEHPACGGGYIVLANSGDRPAFVTLRSLTTDPPFIRVGFYPVLVVPPGEIVNHGLFVHNIPAIVPNSRLQIRIKAEYYWMDASHGRNGSIRRHHGEATLCIDALYSYSPEEV